MGFRSYQAQRVTKTFRHHDTEATHVLRHARHDKKNYISITRQRIEDLEQLMLSELRNTEENIDTAWDTTYVMKEFGGKRPEKDS